MSLNLVEAIQKKLGYAPLHKINPNTQEVITDNRSPVNYLAQATIPAVLIGMYKKAHNDDDCKTILSGINSSSWANFLFENDSDNVVEKITNYSGTTTDVVKDEIEKIAQISRQIIRENVKDNNCSAVRGFFNLQVANLEMYLPGALHLGDSLKDSTLDDRTHKMAGPVSGVMHLFERFFSDAGNKKKPFNPTDDTVHYR